MGISRRLLCAVAVVGVMLLAPAGAVWAQPSERPFAIVPGSFHLEGSTVQAGAHEDLTTTFDFAHNTAGNTFNDVKETVVNLPAGFTGNSTAVPTCSEAQLLAVGLPTASETMCPLATQIGVVTLTVLQVQGGLREETVPLYNLETTSAGVTAEFGFKVALFTQLLDVSVRPGDDGITVTARNIAKLGEARKLSVTVWGVPGSPRHDLERGRQCELLPTLQYGCVTVGRRTEEDEESTTLASEPGHGRSVEGEKPFLANPTSCGPFTATMRASSWEEAPVYSEASTTTAPIEECERVPFSPAILAQPTTRSTDTATGLEVSIVVPQTWGQSEAVATSDLKDATVTLPLGFTINPSSGAGLGACSVAQYEAETAFTGPETGCPPESKIGSIEIETPLLADKITGAVYVAQPYENPSGSLLALYIVARDAARGIIVKVAGEVHLDPLTGQVVTHFLNNPQQPFSRFTLHFRPGATAPLVSPPTCGAYAVQALLTPWSEPATPQRVDAPAFSLTSGIDEGACPPGGVPPFDPQVVAGTVNDAAGAYSPFYLRIERHDGEQELTRFSTVMPPGLTGNLTGIPFCPDADVEAAKNLTGAQEEAGPSCPQASEIGHSITEAGVGTVLAQALGRLYLAGPYHGAPLSIVSITSAKVGPFDLGTVVIRFALNINPTTAQVEVSATGSDPIPHIIKGIVVHVRDIRAYIDRHDFILDPTSCAPNTISNVITGAGADPSNPADQMPVSVQSPFQAADCSSLQFKPEFSVSTSAKTSRVDGASLTAKLTVPGAFGTQANIARVKVELPEQLPSRLPTLQKACTAAQFETNPAGCPPASIIGHAKAITPILPVPLEGPAYFVSHGGEGWPSLVVVLQGYGVTIDLTGTTFISKAGVTSSTFKTVPDQPVTSFELTLPEGPYSALTALGNLCSATKTVTVKKRVTVKVHGRKKTITRKVKQSEPATLQMPTEFVAQNGAEIHQTTPIAVTGCAKTTTKNTKKRPKKRGKARR